MLITGAWANPRFTPDLASMIQNRGNIEQTIKSIKEDKGKGLIDSLLGKPPAEPAPSGASSEAAPADTTSEPASAPDARPSPEDALRQLFGR